MSPETSTHQVLLERLPPSPLLSSGTRRKATPPRLLKGVSPPHTPFTCRVAGGSPAGQPSSLPFRVLRHWLLRAAVSPRPLLPWFLPAGGGPVLWDPTLTNGPALSAPDAVPPLQGPRWRYFPAAPGPRRWEAGVPRPGLPVATGSCVAWWEPRPQRRGCVGTGKGGRGREREAEEARRPSVQASSAIRPASRGGGPGSTCRLARLPQLAGVRRGLGSGPLGALLSAFFTHALFSRGVLGTQCLARLAGQPCVGAGGAPADTGQPPRRAQHSRGCSWR